MSPQEKQVIQMALKYFQMLNAHLEEMRAHILKIEPQAQGQHDSHQVVKDTRGLSSSGLEFQLQAIERELQKILH